MKRGMTLIELLISMTVTSILMLSFSAIWANSIKSSKEQLAQTQIQSETQIIIDKIESDIRKARTTESSYSGYTLGAETLIIQIPAIDSAQNILYSGQTQLLDRVVYYKSGNTVKRKVIANASSIRAAENNTEKTLTTNLVALNFSYIKLNINSPINSEVKTTLTLSKKAGKVTKTSTISSQTTFRNLP
jgi:prepilin-type N-terminal cleavage/methylation domain-containing protein